jgi:hypothetical protein
MVGVKMLKASVALEDGSTLAMTSVAYRMSSWWAFHGCAGNR